LGGVFHVVFDDALKQSSLVGQVTNLPYQAWEEIVMFTLRQLSLTGLSRSPKRAKNPRKTQVFG